MEFNTLIQLFPEDEWQTYRTLVSKGHTPLWKYWEEFTTRHLELGRSERTLENVRDTLRFVIRHLEIYSIEDCNNQNIFEDKLLSIKKKRGHSGTTYNTILKNVKTYFIWLYKREYIQENKLNKAQKCKTIQTAKVAYTPEQVSHITQTIEAHTHAPLQTLRNSIFIRLLNATGARPSELLNLTVSALKKSVSEGYIITVTGVKQITKPRVYEIKDLFFAQTIENYLRHRVKIGRDDEALFISSSKKKPWTYQGVRKLFTGISKKVGFKVTSYGFRRYVATNLHTRGLAIEKIAQHLGHSRLSTTMLYIQNSTEHTLEGITMLEANLKNAFPQTLPSVRLNRRDKLLL